MTIELITGTPGAGKTCYTVAKRLIAENGREVEVEDECGQKTKTVRRVIVAGIRGLVVPHDRLPHTLTGERVVAADVAKWNELDKDGEPKFKRLPGEPVVEVEASLFNWWLWCKLGDLICVDEVQYIVPRGTLGKDPPHYIKTLEIHRHYGVDFIFITQAVELLDPTMRRLVGLHRHVRAVLGGMLGLAMVYEWDHASNVERYTNATKTFYKRKPEYFKLYKSTQAVIAPPKSGRGFVWMLPLLFVLCGVFVWKGTERWRDPNLGVLPVANAAPVGLKAGGAPASASGASPNGWRLDPVLGHVPELDGCFSIGDTCKCLDKAGSYVRITKELCQTSASSFDGLVKYARRPAPAASAVPYGADALPRADTLPQLSLPNSRPS